MPSRILPLSEDAISQIYSSKQITSLPGVVLALLENALDADATKVDISVSFIRGSCTVEDNGCGIPSAEFTEHGGLGKMHHTSKVATEHALHGTAGTYLASLAALSLTSITSRHIGEDLSAILSVHQGRVIARQRPSPAVSELTIFGTHGTRVSVNDLFGNMPVRVKQRASSSTQGTGTDDRSWLELKRDITALLLAWNTPCSVKLRDSESQGRNITLYGSHSTLSSALTERNLNTLHGKAVRYDLRDAFPVLFQAGLAPIDSRTRWIPVSASTSKLTCRGMICLDPSPTRLCQFVSIGIHPCSSTSGHSAIYEAINKLFSNSSFGTVDGQVHSIGEKEKARLFKSRTGKGVDRWPMFVLQLVLKDGGGKLAQGSDDRQLKGVIDVIEAMILQWLSAHLLRPRQTRNRKSDIAVPSGAASERGLRISRASVLSRDRNPAPSPFTANGHIVSPSKRQRTMSPIGQNVSMDNDGFGRSLLAPRVEQLSRIRSGNRAVAIPRKGGEISGARSAYFALPPLEPGSLTALYKTTKPATSSPSKVSAKDVPLSVIPHTVVNLSDDFGSISDTDLIEASTSVETATRNELHNDIDPNEADMPDRDELVEWKDPISKVTFKVNSRTGIVIPADDRPDTGLSVAASASRKRPATAAMATTATGRPLTLNGRATTADAVASIQDIPTFLQDWQNPVFARQPEPSIPVASMFGAGLEVPDSTGKCCSDRDASNYFAAPGHGTQSKLSKVSLQHAKVIRQVDAKFILCSMPCADSSSQNLALVDQHAASERVILESLLSELYTPIDANSIAASFCTNTGCSSTVATALLRTPLVFEITAEESGLLRTQAPLFAQHGILYDLHSATRHRAHHSLSVRTLPPGIAERCKLFSNLLIDLLRSEIWSRVESGKTAGVGASISRGDKPWLDRLGSCPKALLEMLNSRACRSAIMFNDRLSVRECADLIESLGKCVFPFMCAHGRVSMVPIGVVGAETGPSFAAQTSNRDGTDEHEKGGYANAWRKWKGRQSTPL